MIRLHTKYEKNLVYDGEEEGFYSFVIPIKIDEFSSINIGVLGAKYFGTLKNVLKEKEFEEILKVFDKIRPSESFPNAFVSENNFPQRYHLLDKDEQKILVLLSFGEFQPGRYKIFLEGVWLIQEGND